MNKFPTKLTIHFDGLCEPKNPGGIACYAWIISHNGENLVHGKGVVADGGEHATNNYAEYCALGFALKYLVNNNWVGRLHIFGDSQLVVNQVAKRWICNSSHLIGLRDKCIEYLEAISPNFEITWIPREENEQADYLSWQAYDERRKEKQAKRKEKYGK
jgi:ribonuclease HI